MKIIFTITLLFTASFCMGQKKPNPDSVFTSFDALHQKQIAKNVHIQDSCSKAYWNLMQEFVIASGIDRSRISNNSDSTKILPTGILTILKPKKK